MKHKLTKIGNPPYFGQFEAPPSLFCTRPLYPQGVLKVPVGVNNNLLAPVMGGVDPPHPIGQTLSVKKIFVC